MSAVNTSDMKSRNSKYYSGNPPYGHFCWLKQPLLIRQIFFGPIVAVLKGFRSTTLSLSKVQVSPDNSFQYILQVNELKTVSFVIGR